MKYIDFQKISKICKSEYLIERKTKIYNLYVELENLTQSVIQNDYGMLNIYHNLIFNFINDLISMYEKIIFRELKEFKWQGTSIEDQEEIFKYVKDEIISNANNEFDFLEKEVVEFCANYQYPDYWKNCILTEIEDEKTRKINYLNENININIEKVKVKFGLIDLTRKQLKDYDTYEYQSKDKIFISGNFLTKRKNEIIVNDKKIPLGDTLLLLLLKFVVELKKDKKGWISMQSLYEKRIIHYPVRYQIFDHLRTAFKGNLLEKNPIKFIENNDSGYYRISTHPDFVTYNKKKLQKHPEIDQRAFINNEKKKKPEDREGAELIEIIEVAKDLPDN